MDDLPAPDISINSPENVSVVDELSFWSAPFGMRLLESVSYHKGMKALDVGCGLGFPMLELSMRLGKSSSVYGIDPWTAAIQRLKEKLTVYGIENAHVIEGRAEGLPFQSGIFDLVVSNNGVNNVKDLPGAIVEIRRVSKVGSQFVFTFNTQETFIEFYQIFREVLYDMDIPDYNLGLRKHIFAKRKPVAFMENLLNTSGFKIESIRDDIFHYYFSDGSAFLRHFFIRLFFLGSWIELLLPQDRKRVFREIEKRLNDVARKNGDLRLQVPLVVISCRSA